MPGGTATPWTAPAPATSPASTSSTPPDELGTRVERLGLGGVDAGGALDGAVPIAHLPAGLGVTGCGWELDDPGHAVVSCRCSSKLPEELEVLVPAESRKSPGETRSHSSARREKYSV